MTNVDRNRSTTTYARRPVTAKKMIGDPVVNPTGDYGYEPRWS